MSKGQKAIQDTATQRSTAEYNAGVDARNRLRNDPALLARRALVASRRAAINAGDLRNAKDFIGNSANTAAQESQREAKSNLADTGIAGLAENYADPTRIALSKQVQKDEFARDSAAQTESDAKDYINQTSAMESDLIQTDANIESGVMNTAFGTSQSNLQLAAQIAASRSSVLPSILGAAIGGATSIATGGNWFQRTAGGGGGGGSTHEAGSTRG